MVGTVYGVGLFTTNFISTQKDSDLYASVINLEYSTLDAPISARGNTYTEPAKTLS